MSTVLACDLDGRPHTDEHPVVTLSWGVDGQSLEIDVCPDHELELRDVLERHALAGRVISERSTGRRVAASAGSVRRPSAKSDSARSRAANAADIRAWAATAGYQLPSRGRLPKHVREAYEEVHP